MSTSPTGAPATNPMLRADALEAIYPKLARDEVVVVTIMGAVAVELFTLGHRTNFFYLEHAMGLASSMGLGIALSLPQNPVVVIDGDGSLLMNLGTLSTLARYKPGNLTHVVFDNESLLSVGGFPTATSTGTDLAGVAAASGVPNVSRADTVPDFAAAFTRGPGQRPTDDDRGEGRGGRPNVLRHGPAPAREPLPVQETFASTRRSCCDGPIVTTHRWAPIDYGPGVPAGPHSPRQQDAPRR